MLNNFQIAIDGPAGSGKSTIAKLIAKKLGFLYIDSGAMYRALTLFLLKKRLIDCNNNKFKSNLKKINIQFKNETIYLNKKNVSKEIRSSIVTKNVSYVSSKEIIRTELVKRQREIAKNNKIVMDGRDIGTTVFKNANLKIYLTASPVIRAKRRRNDLKAISENVKFQELIKQIQERDDFDSTRKISPLCKSQDAIVIDNNNLSINEIIELIIFFLPIR